MAVSLANLYSDQYTAVSGKRRNLPLAAIIHAQLPAHIAGGERERSEALDERALAETAKRHDTEMALRREELSEAGKQASRAQMIGTGQTAIGGAYVASKLGLIGGAAEGAAIPGAGITGTLTPAVTPGGAEALGMAVPSLAEVSAPAGAEMMGGAGEMMGGAELAAPGTPSLAAVSAGTGGASTAGGEAAAEVAGGVEAAGPSMLSVYGTGPLVGLGVGYGVGRMTGSRAAGAIAGGAVGAGIGAWMAAGTALGGPLGAVVGGVLGIVGGLIGGGK